MVDDLIAFNAIRASFSEGSVTMNVFHIDINPFLLIILQKQVKNKRIIRRNGPSEGVEPLIAIRIQFDSKLFRGLKQFSDNTKVSSSASQHQTIDSSNIAGIQVDVFRFGCFNQNLDKYQMSISASFHKSSLSS